ncbi:hypothetical protein H2200_008709 [Cladophialophora chaetospira]|uniref:Uncharacterized protein n=1 Tax=Cladophialophora chaetospira TaxID=386627 RepID=A0AA39CFT6_9EURO|nr:hypothetical protein H2200_008709 [Cladophialophora chaetospira]
MRLRLLVAHANLLDQMMSQQAGEESVQEHEKLNPQISIPEQIPPPEQIPSLTPVVVGDQMNLSADGAKLAVDDEIDVLLAENLSNCQLSEAISELKKEESIATGTSPAICDIDTEQQDPFDMDANLALCRTLSRHMACPSLDPPSPCADAGLSDGDGILSAPSEQAIFPTAEPPSLGVTAM